MQAASGKTAKFDIPMPLILGHEAKVLVTYTRSDGEVVGGVAALSIFTPVDLHVNGIPTNQAGGRI